MALQYGLGSLRCFVGIFSVILTVLNRDHRTRIASIRGTYQDVCIGVPVDPLLDVRLRGQLVAWPSWIWARSSGPTWTAGAEVGKPDSILRLRP